VVLIGNRPSPAGVAGIAGRVYGLRAAKIAGLGLPSDGATRLIRLNRFHPPVFAASPGADKAVSAPDPWRGCRPAWDALLSRLAADLDRAGDLGPAGPTV